MDEALQELMQWCEKWSVSIGTSCDSLSFYRSTDNMFEDAFFYSVDSEECSSDFETDKYTVKRRKV